jgi:CRISPR-associated protein Csd1
MILESLVALAAREDLVEDPSYQNAGVSFVIVLQPSGQFQRVADLRELNAKKKAMPKVMAIPKRSGRTVNDKEDFLVDKSEYVLGVEPDGKRSSEKLALRLGLFHEATLKAFNATREKALEAVLAFLDSSEQRGRCIAEAESKAYRSNDLFCFRVGMDPSYVHEIDSVRQYWASSLLSDGVSESQQCLICGKVGSPARKHLLLKMMGASSSGVPLISFNKSAFESYGLEGNENAPVCQKCADSYGTAMRRCLEERFPDPKHPDRFLSRQSTVLSKDLTSVYWTDVDASSLLSQLEKVNDKDIEAMATLRGSLEGVWKAQQPARIEGRFYCLFLQGGQGRAAIRGWDSQSTDSVYANLKLWFEQTDVGGKPKPLWAYLNSMAVAGNGWKMPQHFVSTLYMAIVFGKKLPMSFLQLIVERNKAEHSVPQERAALLQVFFARAYEGKEFMSNELSQAGSKAYLLGRLLGVVQSQQRQLNPSLNKNITDRFFTALSSRPASAFPGMISLARNHTSQLSKQGGGSEMRIAGLLKHIDSLPARFSLEEQGQFALGYYHERQEMFEGAKKRKNENSVEGEESNVE